MPIGALIPLMFYVGLIGGAMYANVFVNLSSVKTAGGLCARDLELGINIVSLSVSGGILASSVFDLVADHSFLK